MSWNGPPGSRHTAGRPRKLPVFKLNAADRRMLDEFKNGNLDYDLFCQYYFDWKPKWYQIAFSEARQKNKLFVAGIRTGKSKGVATDYLWYAWTHPGSRQANTSISSLQANIVYRDCSEFASSSEFAHWVEDNRQHPYPQIRLVNGSEIWFRPIGYEAELWRGEEFDRINIDEAGYVVRDHAITTLRGRLLGVGRAGIMTMTTSPKGKGWLYDLWRKGDPSSPGSDLAKYFSLRARTRDNDSLTEDQIAEVEAEYTDRMIAQELEGLFLDSADTIFPYDHIASCYDTTRPEMLALQVAVDDYLRTSNSLSQAEIGYYQLAPRPDHIYLNSWDLGKKTTRAGRNAMVGGVFDITRKPWQMVAYRWAPNSEYGQAHEWIKEWDGLYNSNRSSCETVIDATGKGDVLNDDLMIVDKLPVLGINYSGGNKFQLVHSLQLTLEKGWMVFPFIRRAIDQLQAYELPDDKIAQDVVMMLAQIAFRARQRTGDENTTLSLVHPLTSGRRSLNDPAMNRFIARRRSARTNREYDPNKRKAS